MSRFKLLYFVIFIINLLRINAQISDKRLCVDEECKVPISLARTLLRYSSPDSRILSFGPNVDITIYSKSAGSRTDLWGAEIKGKRGYVPKHLVRETKILQKPSFLVATEFGNDTETNQVPSPDKVQEPYEVVDGTTIFTGTQDAIEPTSTESPLQQTALPSTETEPSKINTPEIGVKVEPQLANASTEDKSTTEPGIEEDEEDIDIDDDDLEEEDDDDDETEFENETPEPPVESKMIEIIENKSEPVTDPAGIKMVAANLQEADKSHETTITNKEQSVINRNLEAAVTNGTVQTDSAKGNLKETPLEDQAKESVANEEKKFESGGEGSKEEKVLQKEEVTKKPEDVVQSGVEGTKDEEKVAENEEDSKKPKDAVHSGVEGSKAEENLAPKEEDSKKLEDVVQSGVEGNKDEEKVAQNEEGTKKPEDVVESGVEGNKDEEKVAQYEEATKNPEDVVQSTVEESRSEENVVQSQEDTESEDMVQNGREESKQEEKEAHSEAEYRSSKEEIAPATIETTTFSAEIEVPQPFDDGFFEVTPNPVELTSKEDNFAENIIPTLPPLGLFGGRNLKTISSEEVVPENTNEQNHEVQNHEVTDTADEAKSSENIEETPSNEIPEEKESAEAIVYDDTSGVNESIEDTKENVPEEDTKEEAGFLYGFVSMFKASEGKAVEEEKLTPDEAETEESLPRVVEDATFQDSVERFCDGESCGKTSTTMDLINFNSDVFLYLVTTAISVIIFLFGYIAFDKSKREGPLVAKINNLEKELLILVKENQLLQDKVTGDSGYDTNDRVSNEVLENLRQDVFILTNSKLALEEQVQSLEKELENSTEVGMELNRMLSEILSSESGSEDVRANVEHLQRQLVEQQATINSINETLAITNTENHELRLELELSNKKVLDLQTELDKLLLNVLRIEEEKETQQASLENEITSTRKKYEEINNKLRAKEEEYSTEIKQLKNRLIQTERNLELKAKEQEVLTETMKQLKAMKTSDGPTMQSLLDASSIKAESQLLQSENQKFREKLQQEEESKLSYQKSAEAATEEVRRLRAKYDEADKLRVETETKLQVLSNYFKDREAQLQKEIAKHESLWVEKQGEATSTTERIKFMQEQLQNYKAQTESLKQEIVSQEVELKSQISVLEKKAHENWVNARQAERKLEEAKQEAAQLRHRLTLRERAIQEDKNQHRFQSPVEQNGDMPVSPLESPASPPLLYGGRDHITKSPAIPGLPPFLPPPPGVPFMPPPLHGVPPFIPPPPTMFPGDHRPPPLGRMSSPPLNSRYSPSSRGYSPYDSSPSDSEYGTSPPQRRRYSPFNSRGDDRRDYKRPPPARTNGRNVMRDGGSSGSGHSNESLEKISRQQSKV